MLASSTVAILMSDQLLLLRETLIALLTLISGLRLPCVYRFMPLKLRWSVKYLATDGARVTLV